MVLLSVVLVLAILLMALLVWRRGPDTRVHADRARHRLLLLAWVPILAQALVLLAFGLGEVSGGDPSGAMHLVTLLPGLLLAALAWRRPLEGGVTFLAVFLLLPILMGLEGMAAFLILVLPGLLAGVLFLMAGLGRPKAAAGQPS